MAVLIVLAGSAVGPGEANEKKEYIPYSNLQRGTEGVNAVPVEIRNDGDGPLRCSASLAHWYSAPVGDAETQGTVRFELWHNPETGVFNLLNELEDRMPVEAIWCGRPPRTHATRSMVRLDYRAGETPASIRHICTDGSDSRVVCREVEHGSSD